MAVIALTKQEQHDLGRRSLSPPLNRQYLRELAIRQAQTDHFHLDTRPNSDRRDPGQFRKGRRVIEL